MTTENQNETLDSVVEIATRGDVILIVGPQERRIQVSSSVLKNASKYFNAMFGPNFSEGQNLGGNNPKEISMPDDDASALEIICNTLHLRNNAVPETLAPSRVLDIAVAADKLDCVVALKLASKLWLKPRDLESSQLGQLMAAAYVLGNDEGFKEVTHALLLRHKGSFLPLADEDVGLLDYVPWQTFCLLEEKRGQMRAKLQQALFHGTTVAGTSDDAQCTCGWAGQYCLAYIQLLQEQELWNHTELVSGMTISRMFGILEDMNDPVPARPWVSCGYRWHRNPEYRRSRQYRLGEFNTEFNGISISSVRSSVTTEQSTLSGPV